MHKILFMAGIVVLFVAGCKTENDFRRERAEKAVRYFELSKLRERALTKDVKLSLAECLNIGLKHNLDIKVLNQEEDIAAEMRTAELLGMLPEINFNNNFSARSNVPASGSQSYEGKGLTYGASQGQDQNLNMFNIDFALNLMDFGLAFFNSQQAQDRVLLRKQRTARMAQNLCMDIINSYCRVAAAQRAINVTKSLLQTNQNRVEQLSLLAKNRQIDAFRAFEEARKFVEMERRLTAYTLDYENSCVELRSLLGYYPSSEIMVDDSFLDNLPNVDLPDLDILEQIALIKRPELKESDIQQHINAVECRKVIMSMFPNTRIFLDYNLSNNSFLYNKSWWEVGLSTTFNLLKLPQKIEQLTSYSKQTDAETMRAYGQSIAIIAQVRISHADIRANYDIYMRSARMYKNYKDAFEAAKKKRIAVASEISRVEQDHMQMTTAESYIEQTIALSNYYVSFYRLMNAIGMNEYLLNSVNKLPAELKEARRQAGLELAKAAEKK